MNEPSRENGVLEGILSIRAALEYESRPVERCYIDREKVKKRDRKVLSLLDLLKEKRVPTELCARETIDAFLAGFEGVGTTHGGVVAVCGKRTFLPYETLLQKTADAGGFCAVLDGIEDPFNFGYAVRNLYAAGAVGILIPERNWMSASGVCARASAGATEMCPMAVLPTFEENGGMTQEQFMKSLQKKGFLRVCAAKTGECEELYSFEPEFPLCLFVGGEKRGISPDFVKHCDCVVCIPYASEVRYSLPAATTAAVFGFYLENKRKTNRSY